MTEIHMSYPLLGRTVHAVLRIKGMWERNNSSLPEFSYSQILEDFQQRILLYNIQNARHSIKLFCVCNHVGEFYESPHKLIFHSDVLA
jgi:hypothetical protein